MKQTAVEWLCEKYYLKQDIEIIKEAKEMEKQQIMNANVAGINQGLYGYKNAEEYYNKTFKNK